MAASWMFSGLSCEFVADLQIGVNKCGLDGGFDLWSELDDYIANLVPKWELK
jgi:hypothetical protein